MTSKVYELFQSGLPSKILEANDFTQIDDSFNQSSVFKAFSLHLSKTIDYSEQIRKSMSLYLQSLLDSADFPSELDFLKTEKHSFEIYQKFNVRPSFDSLNFFLISMNLAITIEIFSFSPLSKNLVSSIFNPGREITFYFYYLQKKNQTFYIPIKLKNSNQDSKIMLIIDNIIIEISRDQKNEPAFPIPIFDESVVNLEMGIRRFLGMYDQINEKCSNFENQQKISQSAQKEILPMFSFDTKSIAKSVLTNNQQFDFSNSSEKKKSDEKPRNIKDELGCAINKPPGLLNDYYPTTFLVFRNPEAKDTDQNTPNVKATPNSVRKRRIFFGTTSLNFDKEKRYTGEMENFNLERGYGFIHVDGFANNIFVHFDDLEKGGVTLEVMKHQRKIEVSFSVMSYFGTNKYESVKAVNIELVKDSNDLA